jgi:hypothetical protein
MTFVRDLSAEDPETWSAWSALKAAGWSVSYPIGTRSGAQTALRLTITAPDGTSFAGRGETGSDRDAYLPALRDALYRSGQLPRP